MSATLSLHKEASTDMSATLPLHERRRIIPVSRSEVRGTRYTTRLGAS
jgi:hypothetical protein